MAFKPAVLARAFDISGFGKIGETVYTVFV